MRCLEDYDEPHALGPKEQAPLSPPTGDSRGTQVIDALGESGTCEALRRDQRHALNIERPDSARGARVREGRALRDPASRARRVADKNRLRIQLATAPRCLTFHIVLAN